MVRRTNWGGSIATFIVVTVILLAGLVGAIYILNQRGKQARSGGEIATTSTTKKTNSSGSTSSSTGKETSKQTTSGNSGQSSEKTPSALGQTGYLPQTGPEISPIEILAVFALSSSVVAYAVSRRKSGGSSLT